MDKNISCSVESWYPDGKHYLGYVTLRDIYYDDPFIYHSPCWLLPQFGTRGWELCQS
jgi:hypothetical protein